MKYHKDPEWFVTPWEAKPPGGAAHQVEPTPADEKLLPIIRLDLKLGFTVCSLARWTAGFGATTS